MVLISGCGCGWGGGWVAVETGRIFSKKIAVVCLWYSWSVWQWSGGSDSHGVG
jgi:hypothetical protein